jgi:hypothetical protein
MDISPHMTDAELKQFIDNSEPVFHERGVLYEELINAGYSKEKLDRLIAEKKEKERNSFRNFSLFFSFILILLGVLTITGYFGRSWFALSAGLVFCGCAAWLIRRAFE